MRELMFYTDGAYSSKTQMGGWAMVCLEDNKIINEQTGYEPYTTGNRMEFTALLTVLEYVNSLQTEDTTVEIFTDSAYVSNTFNLGWFRTWLNNGWKTADRQDVKNQDILRRVVALYIKLKQKYNLQITKVKGHKDNKWNVYVDHLAVKARKELEF